MAQRTGRLASPLTLRALGALPPRIIVALMTVDRFVNPEWLVEMEVNAVTAGWGD